jgi:hypothetical protein
MAEAVRFELTNGFPRRQFSRLLPSTTRPRFLREPALYINHRSPGSAQPGYAVSNQFSRKLSSNSYAGSGLAYR